MAYLPKMSLRHKVARMLNDNYDNLIGTKTE